MARATFLFSLVAIDLGFSFTTTSIDTAPNWAKSANWEETPIMNRSAPVVNYANSSSETFSISLKLYAFSRSNVAEIGNISKNLKDLVSPIEPGIAPPSRCRITYRPHFDNYLCVCESVSISGPETLHWDKDGNPMDISVELAFKEIDIINKKAMVVGGGAFEYVPHHSRTFNYGGR